jgi:CubicO group peptidase (beta-lactamase class C family)
MFFFGFQLNLRITNPLKNGLLKNLIRLLPVLLLLYACGTNDEKENASFKKSSSDLNNSGVSKISPADFKRYRNAASQFVDSILGKGRLNGMVLVAKNGEIVYEKYTGFRNPRAHSDSITPTTPFHLASVSKTITAMAVLKLCQEGKLNIDDSLAKYLPGFPLTGITVRSLLNHRSGLPNYVHYMERLGWNKKQFITNQDVLDFIIARHDDIDIGPPNRRFSYSNTNYALLALLIEKVSGKSYGEYLQTTFFVPLGMKDTYVFTRADSARSLPSYFYNGRQYAFDFLDFVYGDKNIYSTVRDLLKFDQALYSGTLLNKQMLTEAYTPYSFEKPGTHNYGLGWRMLLLKNGKKIIYHNGWWHGNRTAFYRLLDENVTIIALCNNDSKMVYNTKQMADIFGNYLQNGDDETEGITLR